MSKVRSKETYDRFCKQLLQVKELLSAIQYDPEFTKEYGKVRLRSIDKARDALTNLKFDIENLVV